ncbi:MAG: hypothetical protein IJO26_05635 [Clostridium sp.]|nr:hypothetical protein [Clostridium sp.]
MKKRLSIVFLIILNLLMISCSKDSLQSEVDESTAKNVVDLVLSYEKGYDETMKKHISEKNFYVSNYLEFYSNYIGNADITDYSSEVVSFRESQERYIVCMILNIKAIATDTHEHEEGEEGYSDEAIGENIPIEVILKERDGELYIESFTEYENLEKAKELNGGFK